MKKQFFQLIQKTILQTLRTVCRKLCRHGKLLCKIFLFATLLCVLTVIGINAYMIHYAKPYIYKSVEALPQKYTVIVPGGKVYNTTVSHVVRDRIEAAASCIKAQKAARVLISGDHGRKNYDEVNQMRLYMQKIYAVDESLIFLDHAGFSTYETMYRAKAIFCVTDAVVTTQAFHTVRSVYIARKLGIDAVANEAPEVTRFTKRLKVHWIIRESLARVKTFFLVLFSAKPTYLGEQIPITGEAKASWDML